MFQFILRRIRSISNPRLWILGLLLYIFLELRAYRKYAWHAIELAGYRTPLSLKFDYAKWKRFFFWKITDMAHKRPQNLINWIHRLFCSVKDISKIPRCDIEEWLSCYSSCAEEPERAPCREFELEIKQLADLIEDKTKTKFARLEDSHHHNFLRMNNVARGNCKPAHWFHPLPMRLFRKGWNSLAHGALHLWGFENTWDSETGISYWTKFSTDSDQALMFFGGVGFGVAQYMHFFIALRCHYKGTLVVAEMPIHGAARVRDYEKLRWRTPFPSSDEVADSILQFKRRYLDGLQLDACGHSFGGFVVNVVRNVHPDIFRKVAFLETNPLFECATSMFQPMDLNISVLDLIKKACRLDFMFIAVFSVWTDVTLQHIIKRCVWFMEWCDREDQLDDNILFILAKDDGYIPCEPIMSWLHNEKPLVQTMIIPGEHGASIGGQTIDVCRRVAQFFNSPVDRHKSTSFGNADDLIAHSSRHNANDKSLLDQETFSSLHFQKRTTGESEVSQATFLLSSDEARRFSADTVVTPISEIIETAEYRIRSKINNLTT